ncbi:DUF1499 domain-containing protein [Granulosicoccus sp. 3-233]|uniref:DUF1499 domain-containing protein n=1 Tax=Granulosicoccus sp. 3-233 TaxID=3417969 RepID=UPI003D32D405
MSTRSSRTATLLLIIAVCAALATAIMMFGARLGLWEPIVGFGYYREYAAPLAYAVSGLSLAGLLFMLVKRNSAGIVKTGLACILGLALLYPTLKDRISPPAPVPPIHDITTDTDNPPRFLVLDDSREGARNTLVHGGPEIAAQQQSAYPDIAPIQSQSTAEAAFARALDVAHSMKWEIVSQDDDNLRFEATARTPVFQFADDVVVVVTPEDGASRVDIRSVSRIGRSDRGVNAARIRAFIEAF